MSNTGYLHGYSEWEQSRLIEQNEVLAKYIYDRLHFNGDEHVLEIGCGVGAQMIYLLEKHPNLRITGVDIDASQISKARENLMRRGISEDRFQLINIDAHNNEWVKDLEIDIVFTVWVLEHLNNPGQFLLKLFNSLPSGVRFYATETYHKSLDLIPSSDPLLSFWTKMIHHQQHIGGDPNIGLSMGDLFSKAGFRIEWHSPFPMLFDRNKSDSRLEMLEYWHGLLKASEVSMRDTEMWNEDEWNAIDHYLAELKTNHEAIFYYTFMQLSAIKD